MKKIVMLAAVCVLVTAAARGAEDTQVDSPVVVETREQKATRMKWFEEARFGMFIHWGLYSIPAGEWKGKDGYDEWILEKARIPLSEYVTLARAFNPVQFDASEWVRMAKDAGVKYIVITSKHHDGFGLYPSTLTDWCIKSTPFQRDPLKELAGACRQAGIIFCTYHSIMDWHHPDYLNRRDYNDLAMGKPDMDRYTAYMKGQLKEIITAYQPGIMWFDGEWESAWTHERAADLYAFLRELDPKLIINNRIGKGRAGMSGMDKGKGLGDYGTPEQQIPPTGFGEGVYWESCMTMNHHWGYNKDDQAWKSTTELVRKLVDCASKGGNYLLNVGPTAEGLFPDASVERLAAIGKWMKVNGESIYGTQASPFKSLAWGRCTQKPGKLYLHVFNWPGDGKLVVPGLKNTVDRGYMLAGGREVTLAVKVDGANQVVEVGPEAQDPIATVIVLEIRGPADVSGDEPTTHASQERWSKEIAETQIKAADSLWLNGSAGKAIPIYESLLKMLPPESEPFRGMVIMRLAQAQFEARETANCLNTLKSLDALDYVPEHYALAAKELAEVVHTGNNPGHARTPVPPLAKTSVTIEVSPEGPVRTLSAALMEARKAMTGNPSVEIVLAPGCYVQTETLMLGEQDSGLVIRSKDPENAAVITGGVTLKNWQEVTDSESLSQLPESVRDRVRVCNLTAHGIDSLGELVFGGFSSERAGVYLGKVKSFPIPELFYEGEPQTMARWPNDRLTQLPIDATPETPDSRYARWAREKDLWLYGYWHWDWADAYEKVAGIDAEGRISLAPPTNRYGFRRKQGCAVNALCELDQTGEWHLDTTNHQIHYLPPEDFDAGACVLSAFGTVIAARNCDRLQLRNIKIEYIRGDALTFQDCPRLLLVGVDIQNCSGRGIEVEGGREHVIHSCQVSGMGRGGIDFAAGDWQKLTSCDSIIENCRISNLSRIDRTYTPAILLAGMGIKVRHNAFVNIPSSAIRVDACDALIELNCFQRCVYESGDQGAIDMWANPLYRGNVIRWNDFDRIISGGGHYGAAAVRHDDFISGFMVSENIFRKGSSHGFGAVQFNQGTDNYVDGNIFVDWHKAFSGWSPGGDTWRQNVTSHRRSKQVLAETDWQSDAWRKKYPMVRDLLNGDDNHNYLVDNQRLGSGSWGGVGGAIMFANVEGDDGFHGETLKSVSSVLVPWHKIPVDLIGPYDATESITK